MPDLHRAPTTPDSTWDLRVFQTSPSPGPVASVRTGWLWPSLRHARRRQRAAAGLACGVIAVVATEVRRCWHRCFRLRPRARARAGVRERSPSRVRARRRRRRRRVAADLACGVGAVVATERPCCVRRCSRSPCRRQVAAARRSSRRRSRPLGQTPRFATARHSAAARRGDFRQLR